MAANPFTLAALATTAAPGIEVVRVAADEVDRDVESCAVVTADGRTLRVIVPRTPAALDRAREQSRALRVFTPAVRERLPFEVPSMVGEAPLQRTAVLLSTRLGGSAMELDDVSPARGSLATSIGTALAAVHELPTSIAVEAGVPHRSVGQIREALLAVFDRVASTGKAPAALLARWEQALDDSALWQFTPRIIHGDLQAQAFRRDGDAVVGIDGWHALAIDDPARDLAWLLGSEHFSSVDEAFVAYAAVRGSDRQLRRRAMVHAELAIARWLLHGVDTGDADIVEDGAQMLASLVARVDGDDSAELRAERLQTMDLTAVQELLDQRGSSPDPSRTASHEHETVELRFDRSDVSDSAPSRAPIV